MVSVRTSAIHSLAVVLVLAASCSYATADVIVDYFNGYGATDTALAGNGTAGSGWADVWTAQTSGGTPLNDVDYVAGASLSFSNPGYSNAGNLTGSADGTAGELTGASSPSSVTYRQFATPLTGTIWVSALARIDSPNDAALLWFDCNTSSSSGNNAIGLFGTSDTATSPFFKYAGSASWTSDSFAVNQTYLYLAKIVIDQSGTNDSIEYWIKSSGDTTPITESTLGTPIASRNTADALGTAVERIGVSFDQSSGGQQLDNLRISNGPNGFDDVMGVPEPSTLALALLASITIVGIVRLRRLA